MGYDAANRKSVSASQPVAKIFERNEIHSCIQCINIE